MVQKRNTPTFLKMCCWQPIKNVRQKSKVSSVFTSPSFSSQPHERITCKCTVWGTFNNLELDVVVARC